MLNVIVYLRCFSERLIYFEQSVLPWSQRFFLIFPRIREPQSGEHESRSSLRGSLMQRKIKKHFWNQGNSVTIILF